MSLIRKAIHWRDRRWKLAKLRFDIEDRNKEFEIEVASKGLRKGTDEYNYADWRCWQDNLLSHSEIDQIETAVLIKRARRWEVPLPTFPDDRDEGNAHWYWSQPHGAFYLTTEGKMLLRREAYAEMEIRFKPWLSVAAIVISVISLIISFV